MLRRKECIGLALTALGIGLLLAIALDGLLCRFLLGTGCVMAGCLCMMK